MCGIYTERERKKEKGSFISLSRSLSREPVAFFSDELQTCNFFNEPLLIHKLQSVVRVVFFFFFFQKGRAAAAGKGQCIVYTCNQS